MHIRKYVVSSVFVLLLAPQVGHAQIRCGAAIDQQLRRLDVPKDSVTDTMVRRDSTQEGGLQGYIAWLRLRQCRGHLVMNMSTQCLIGSVYTTRDCRVRGVENY